jgi:hypothetical protein
VRDTPVLDEGAFRRWAGVAVIVAGVGGIAYSAAFTIFLKGHSTGAGKLSTVLLFGGGIVVIVAWLGIGEAVGEGDRGFGRLAAVLGVLSGAGMAIHGAYDLANFVKPPGDLGAAANLPNAVDPRGLMTFGVAGLAILIAAWAASHRPTLFPRALTPLGTLAGVLLEVVYFGRLIVLDPNKPFLLGAAVISGFVVTPAWFVWTGATLLRAPRPV